jgi:FkbM family methyltransferase
MRPAAPDSTLTLVRHVFSAVRNIFDEITRASRICADLPSFVRLSTDLISYRTLAFRKRPFDNRERCVRFRNGVRIIYRSNQGDIWSIREVWLYDLYRLPFVLKPRVLVDLGGNIGLTTVWLSKQYECDLIVILEPSTSNAALARRNLADNNIKAEVIEAAIGAKDRVGRFCEDDRSNQGCLAASGRAVPVLSMNTVLRSIPEGTMIDLVKLDIEGGEQELLADADLSWLSRVRSLIVEFHPALVDYPGLIARLQNAGFSYYAANTVFPDNMDAFIRDEPLVL